MLLYLIFFNILHFWIPQHWTGYWQWTIALDCNTSQADIHWHCTVHWMLPPYCMNADMLLYLIFFNSFAFLDSPTFHWMLSLYHCIRWRLTCTDIAMCTVHWHWILTLYHSVLDEGWHVAVCINQSLLPCCLFLPFYCIRMCLFA